MTAGDVAIRPMSLETTLATVTLTRVVLTSALAWTLVPALVHSAPPLDVVESAMWGREWVIGTYKHPAMPAWLIELSRSLNGGAVGWPVYLISQIFNATTLWLTFLLARDLSGERVGAVAVLSLLGVEYFSWRSFELNHTIAQLPFWVGAALCAWRALQRDTLVWWVALGAVAAVGLYAKLSNAMMLITIAGWLLATPRGRAAILRPGPWIAALVFCLLGAGIVKWLLASDFAALAYAEGRGRTQTVWAKLLFPAGAVLQALPVVLMLAAAGAFNRHGERFAVAVRPNTEAERFLLVMAVAPPLLAIVSALAGSAGLRVSWMAPALPLLAVLLASKIEPRLTDNVLERLHRLGAGVAVALPLIYLLLATSIGTFSNFEPLRVNWPQAEMARARAARWSQETGGKPLRIVAGSAWTAGLVGLNQPDRPSIMSAENPALSPWVTPERLKRDGALVVWIHDDMAKRIGKLIEGRPISESRIAFPRGGKAGHELVVKYVVLPPE